MKTSKVIITLFVSLAVILLMQYGCKDKPEDGVVYSDCHIKDFVGIYNFDNPNLDEIEKANGQIKPLTDSSHVGYKLYGLGISGPTFFDCSNTYSKSLKNSLDASTDQSDLIIVLKDTLKEFTIYSDKPYDNNHPAGQSLNDLFILTHAMQYYSDDYMGNFPLYIPQFIQENPVAIVSLFFNLTEPPTVTDVHVFTIKYRDSYSSFELRSLPIYIKP